MQSATSGSEPMLDPVISLRSLMTLIGRKRRTVLVYGLIGLIVGASLNFLVPHKYTAQTDLYLAVPAGVDPLHAMVNNVSLLQTEVVAKKAAAIGRLSTTPHALLSHYSGVSVSDNILTIKFNGPSQSAAVSGAKAVAAAFLAVQARELHIQAAALVQGLQNQISTLNGEIGTLNAKIDALSATAPAANSSSNLTDLVNQRSQDETQLSQLQTQREQALLNDQTTDRASSVLDPAVVVPKSTKKIVLVDALSGLVAGLAIGLAVVVFGALLSRRPLDRANVATTLGAPVELSLEHFGGAHLMRRWRLARRLRTPSPALQMIERRLRVHLESAPGSTLAVVAMGAAEPAALAVGGLGFALSSEGHRVVVVDAANGRPLASILGLPRKARAMEAFPISSGGALPVRVLVAPQDPMQMARKPPPDDADALVVLVTLDAAFGAEHLTPWVTDAVVILSSRAVTTTQMDVSQRMLREAGISLRSVILLDEDPEDETSGALSPVDIRPTPIAAESAESSD